MNRRSLAVLFITALAFAVLFFWAWRSGVLWLLLEQRTTIEDNCNPDKSRCLRILRTRDSGVDYTTSVYIIWEKGINKLSSLPESYLVFDPEVSVELEWHSQNSVTVKYEGGEYQLFGEMPQDFSIQSQRPGKSN